MKKILLCILALSIAACVPAQATTSAPTVEVIPPTETQISQSPTEEATMKFEISSPTFKNGEADSTLLCRFTW